MSRRRIVRGLSVVTLLLTGGFFWRHATSADPAPQPAPVKAVATTEALGGKDRILTHVATDKPIYKIGETVYVRGVLLNAADHHPLDEKQQIQAQLEILGPKGETIVSQMAQSQDSVLGFGWKVPEGQAGGEYTAKVSFPWVGHPAVVRKFDVRVYRAPRLKTQIKFLRDGYGPGDSVAATLHVERAEGGIPEGSKVTIVGRVDGVDLPAGESVVTATGDCFAKFDLPKEIARGEGTIVFTVEDGGVIETAAKTIPILLQTVDLQMYPEGGDLVAGVANRVYLEARTPAKKPADLAGEIVDDETGKTVARLRTEHEGRGRFDFVPQAGHSYRLKIVEPKGIRTTYPLPAAKTDGVALSALKDVYGADEPVALNVTGSTAGELKVVLSRREVAVGTQTVKIAAGKTQRVNFAVPAETDGVLVATVWNAAGLPVAERLVFRRPSKGVQVEVKADRDRYVPGGKVKLTVRTTDEQGQPVGSVVGLSVVDDSVLEMVETREQAPRLPVMVFLEHDVRELADAHVYLDASNPQAPRAVDLLLGTQGWRRFAFVETTKFAAEHGDAARRVLALTIPTPQERRYLKAMNARGGDVANEFRLGAVPPGAPLPGRAAPVGAAAPVPEAAPAADPQAPAVAVPDVAGAAPPVVAPILDGKAAAAQAAAPFAKQIAPEELPANRKELQEALGKAEEKQAVNGLRRRIMADRDELVEMNFVVVREYAHPVRPNRQPGERTDFAETLFWHAGLKTDPKTGEAHAEFALSDSVTSFKASADAFDARGALGQGTAKVESVEPFYLEPKLPLQLTSGDLVRLPLGLVNATPGPLSNLELTASGTGLRFTVPGPGTLPQSLAADTRLRQIVELDTAGFSGRADVTLRAAAGGFADQVVRPLDVRPLGFPIEIAKGGMIDRDSTLEREIAVPQGIVAGSLKSRIRVFPTPLASMTGALERLLQEPYGCFEQTSSTTYPLVMAQQYFLTHTGVDPKLVQRGSELLDKGYARLTSYECKQGGYEWFGQDPGHEALTAFGLMEFKDMSEVRPVDTAMLERTRKWLMTSRDGKGGYKRERRALHTWLADADVSNAYITWALLSAGETGLDKEIDTVEKSASASTNSYELALAANVLVLAGRKAQAEKLFDRLAEKQSVQGEVQGATKSIIGSGGEALAIETTALATLAWLSDREYADFADKGIRYLAEVCKAGRFGSTQSSVLALKAIVAQDKLLAKPKAAGTLQLLVDGKPVGQPLAFDPKTEGALELPDVASLLTPGTHKIAVKMTGGSTMPASLAVSLHSTQPDSSAKCQVGLEVTLADAKLVEGAVTEARVVVTNRSAEALPTPIAIVGLPGGLEVRHDQLKELVKADRIAAYEVLGREVVLYWRDLGANAKVELPLSAVAAIPGKFAGPASRAYLYYTDEHKQWSAPLSVEIAPRAE